MADVYPCVRYDDPHAAITWLVDVLGLREVARYDDGDRVAHAEYAFGDGCVMLGSRPSGEYGAAVGRLGPAEIYLATDDVHAHHDRAVAAGANVVRPLAESQGEGWGYTVLDPEGNAWSIGTYRAAL